MRNYTEGVYKRKRNGRIVFDGVLAYYDENGKRKFAHRERNKESLAREAIRQLRKDLEKRGPKAVKNKVVTFAHLADYCETEIYVQAEHNEEGEKTNSGVQEPSTYKSHIKHFRQILRG